MTYGEKVFIVSNCDEHERIYNEQFGTVVDTFTDDNGHGKKAARGFVSRML